VSLDILSPFWFLMVPASWMQDAESPKIFAFQTY
jgi:hypothetical protein